MKKLFFGLLLMSLSIIMFAQEKKDFKFSAYETKNCKGQYVFQKDVAQNFYNDKVTRAEEYRQNYFDVFILDSMLQPLETWKKIDFLTIDTKHKFVRYSGCITNYNKQTQQEWIMLRNINDKKYYVLLSNVFAEYDYNLANFMFKVIQPELNTEQKAMLVKYKSLIQSCKQNMEVLNSIQNKYTNVYGLFVETAVNATDKANYNKTLNSLKSKYKQISDMNSKDEGDVVKLKLTDKEYGYMMTAGDWAFRVNNL